jgi:hypothetical protein
MGLGMEVCEAVGEDVKEGVRLGNWMVIEARGINVVVDV